MTQQFPASVIRPHMKLYIRLYLEVLDRVFSFFNLLISSDPSLLKFFQTFLVPDLDRLQN